MVFGFTLSLVFSFSLLVLTKDVSQDNKQSDVEADLSRNPD